MEFDNIETIKQALAIGAGVSILPEPTVWREARLHTLVVVPFNALELVRPLGILHRRRKILSAAVRKFIELLRAPDEGPPGSA
jgi:DNA-binding transcriptional LysR family regulator